MAFNEVRIMHGLNFRVGAAANPGSSTTAITGSSGSKVGNVINVSGSPGVTAEIATSSPLDSTSVIKRKGIQNPGQMTIECLRDDNDAGQAIMLAAAKNATQKYPFYLGTTTSNDGTGFDAFVTAATNPGGGSGDFNRVSYTLELTSTPT